MESESIRLVGLLDQVPGFLDVGFGGEGEFEVAGAIVADGANIAGDALFGDGGGVGVFEWVEEPLVDDFGVGGLLVFDDHGCAVFVDAEGVHASAGLGTGRELGGEEGELLVDEAGDLALLGEGAEGKCFE